MRAVFVMRCVNVLLCAAAAAAAGGAVVFGSDGADLHSLLSDSTAAGAAAGPQEPAGGALLPSAAPHRQPSHGTHFSSVFDFTQSDNTRLILTLSSLQQKVRITSLQCVHALSRLPEHMVRESNSSIN